MRDQRCKELIVNTAAMGGAFEFTRIAAANLREKDDSWNPAIGGFFGGAVVGMKCQHLGNRHDILLILH